MVPFAADRDRGLPTRTMAPEVRVVVETGHHPGGLVIGVVAVRHLDTGVVDDHFDGQFCMGSTIAVSLRVPRLPSGLRIWKVWPCRYMGCHLMVFGGGQHRALALAALRRHGFVERCAVDGPVVVHHVGGQVHVGGGRTEVDLCCGAEYK